MAFNTWHLAMLFATFSMGCASLGGAIPPSEPTTKHAHDDDKTSDSEMRLIAMLPKGSTRVAVARGPFAIPDTSETIHLVETWGGPAKSSFLRKERSAADRRDFDANDLVESDMAMCVYQSDAIWLLARFGECVDSLKDLNGRQLAMAITGEIPSHENSNENVKSPCESFGVFSFYSPLTKATIEALENKAEKLQIDALTAYKIPLVNDIHGTKTRHIWVAFLGTNNLVVCTTKRDLESMCAPYAVGNRKAWKEYIAEDWGAVAVDVNDEYWCLLRPARGMDSPRKDLRDALFVSCQSGRDKDIKVCLIGVEEGRRKKIIAAYEEKKCCTVSEDAATDTYEIAIHNRSALAAVSISEVEAMIGSR